MVNLPARVGRDKDGWWVCHSGNDALEPYRSFDDLPDEVRRRIAVLLAAPDGFRDERIGRRITEDRFWLFGESA